MLRRISHVQRYIRVLEVLARHGFADAAQRIGLDTLVDRGRGILGAAPKESHEPVARAVRIRRVLEELGPTFVKLGQVLSTRPDLVPKDWAEEFKKLLDDVPGVEFDDIRRILETEFPGEVNRLFRSISKKPLAAASIAQVHQARLHNGARIVLKILRPGIRHITEVDMDILHTLAEVAEAHFANLGYSPAEVVSEFAKELAKELDLVHEGRSTDRFRALFDDDPEVVFPRVYWEATTANVLALEEIRGVVLTRLDGAVKPRERRRLVENGARAVFRQCLEFGFFHADPHPGNLIALPGGRIAFIDCGMTGQLDARTMQSLADLVNGVVAGDLDRVVAAVGALADLEPDKLAGRDLRADIEAIVAQVQGVPLEHINLGRLLDNFFAALRAHHVRCPANLIFLIKALTTIESVGRQLDPAFEMIQFARPFIEKLVQKRYSIAAVRARLRRSLIGYAEFIEDLPGEVRPLLSQLRRNKLAVNLEHRGLNRLTRAIEHASRNVSLALIIAAMLVGSSILVLAARTPGLPTLTALGIAGLGAAAVLTVLMIFSNRRYRDG
jgi:ubiquinone biosynthesis protein